MVVAVVAADVVHAVAVLFAASINASIPGCCCAAARATASAASRVQLQVEEGLGEGHVINANAVGPSKVIHCASRVADASVAHNRQAAGDAWQRRPDYAEGEAAAGHVQGEGG